MLTAHSLCWLCQMPLAIASWGICSRCASALLASEPLCPQCGLPAQSSTLPLRALPAKTAAVAAAGDGE